MVTGGVAEEQIVIRGKMRGHLKASHVILSSGSEIEADVEQMTLTVELGAKLTGSVRSMASALPECVNVGDDAVVLNTEGALRLFI